MRHFIEQIQSNDHVALIYRNRVEQFAAAIPYIRVGLERNERCLYIASDNPVRTVIEAMEADGIDVDREVHKGRLTIATPAETYTKHGVFEPEAMIEGLTAEVKRALADGFKTFRATGELFWALSLPSALLRLHEYEALLDLRYPNAFIGLCQYNEAAFRPEIISQMLRVHPKVIARGKLFRNPHYVSHGRSMTQSLIQVGIDDLTGAAA
jgi:chemotaxis family two-component system sensor kinase Cph1